MHFRKINHFAFAVSLLLALAACSKDGNVPAPSATPSPAPLSGLPDDGPATAITETATDNTDNQEGGDTMPDTGGTEELAAHFEGISLAESLKNNYCSNPVMTQRFGADPYALVYDGRVYLYMTGDVLEYGPDGSVKANTYGKVKTICVVSSADLANWTDHGTIYAAGYNGAATWSNNSWAPAAACREIDGKMKFFLYFANGAGGIAVLSADSPTGPFTDPLGSALISRSTENCSDVTWLFDPAVLLDDDGSAYLYFGGGIPGEEYAHPGTARAVKLGDDMISLDGAPVAIDAPYLFEDSGINKIGDTYYYSYCTNWNVDAEAAAALGIKSAQIAYMTSQNPLGPFTLQGSILKNPGEFFGCYGNNHHCIFEFNGKWYITYHTQILENLIGISGGYRCTHIDEVNIAGDGSIAPITATKGGVPAISKLDPYQKTEAETIHTMAGLETVQCGMVSNYYGSGNMALSGIDTGDWLMVSNVDFKDGATSFTASVHAGQDGGGIIKVCLDSANGDAIAYLGVTPDGTQDYREETALLLAETSGEHKLYFVFYGSGYTVDYWYFQ